MTSEGKTLAFYPFSKLSQEQSKNLLKVAELKESRNIGRMR